MRKPSLPTIREGTWPRIPDRDVVNGGNDGPDFLRQIFVCLMEKIEMFFWRKIINYVGAIDVAGSGCLLFFAIGNRGVTFLKQQQLLEKMWQVKLLLGMISKSRPHITKRRVRWSNRVRTHRKNIDLLHITSGIMSATFDIKTHFNDLRLLVLQKHWPGELPWPASRGFIHPTGGQRGPNCPVKLMMPVSIICHAKWVFP